MSKKGDFTPRKNLIGEKFGKLTVIEYAGFKEGRTGVKYHQWLCQCECGNTKIATTTGLTSGHCRSCGCMPHTPINQYHKHYQTDTRLYNIWKNMKGRCYTPSNSGYSHYGERGITVCDEWKNDYMAFYKWAMENGYDENAPRGECTLDRIDVYGNYEPSNCRWVDMKMQSTNRTRMTFREYDNILYTTKDLAARFHIPYKILKGRIDRGETIEQALFGNHNTYKITIEYNNEEHTIPEWSKITGIKTVTLYSRYYKGLTPEQIFKPPIDKK